MNLALNTGVYKLTAPSGKTYIGQSVNLKQRFYDYARLASGIKDQKYIYAALKKYGWDEFKAEVVAYTFDDEVKYLCVLEDYFMNLYKSNSRECGYNIKGAGHHGKHSAETIEKMCQAKLGNKANLGRKFTEEHKAKIGAANKLHTGRVPSEETRKKLSAAFKGVKRGKYPSSRIFKKPVRQLKDGILVAIHESATHAARLLDLSQGHISDCVNGKRKTTGGYQWEFINEQ